MAVTLQGFDEAVTYVLRAVGKERIVLKTEQLQAIHHIYDGKDVFLWLPTGFGKSICYETLPFVFDYKFERVSGTASSSIVIVVSPLVSLMADQVLSLRKRGVKAAILSGHAGVAKELQVTDRELRSCDFSLLFSSPEAIAVAEKWRQKLLTPPLSSRVVAIAIDEAHCISKWSQSFRPAYSRLNELRALVPPGVPMIAATATVTKAVRDDVITKLEMQGCELVYTSPNRPNIYYEVRPRTDIETDFAPLVSDLQCNFNKAKRVIVYCRSYNMCADLYEHFLFSLGDSCYYPSGALHVSDNRLIAMYHANTPSHNKDVIFHSMQKPDGVVRVVFATVALGMGINFASLNTTIHYGAPSTIEDYFQESGRVGRSGEQGISIVFWKPSDAPNYKDTSKPRHAELAAVRRYLENTEECRRCQLLCYFDPELVALLPPRDLTLCCNVCARSVTTSTN